MALTWALAALGSPKDGQKGPFQPAPCQAGRVQARPRIRRASRLA